MQVKLLFVLGIIVLLIVSCGPKPYVVAVAELEPKSGSTTKGILTFYLYDTRMELEGKITGLSPGSHGLHVHESGDCSDPAAATAGGHFNPLAMAHGDRDAMPRHIGDLGNIEADVSGIASVYIETGFDLGDQRLDHDPSVPIEGGLEVRNQRADPESLIGRALIVHEKADDLITQPSGNSGARVACGIIRHVE